MIPIVFQYIGNVIKRVYQLIIQAPKCDVIIFQKGVLPALPVTFIQYLRKRGCKIIFDVDDAIYLSQRDHSNRIAKQADAVIVGNSLLANYYKQFNKHVVVLPTVDYTPAYIPYRRDTFHEKCIGWIGSQSTIGNLRIVAGAINRVVEKYPEVKFRFIANVGREYERQIRNAGFINWTLDTYIQDMSGFTVGIMPLYDNAFNRGKCGFKLIQYMNLYKPVIASPVGVNSEIVRNCGFIAETEDEWFVALEKLLFDRQIYRDCVKHIKAGFEDDYSYEKILDAWVNLIDKM